MQHHLSQVFTIGCTISTRTLHARTHAHTTHPHPDFKCMYVRIIMHTIPIHYNVYAAPFYMKIPCTHMYSTSCTYTVTSIHSITSLFVRVRDFVHMYRHMHASGWQNEIFLRSNVITCTVSSLFFFLQVFVIFKIRLGLS